MEQRLKIKKQKPIAAPLRLDFGCGKNPREGFLGVDAIDFGQKYVLDLRKPWPWKNGTVAEAHSSHFVEHLEAAERIHFVNELHRVLVPGGKCQVITPHWASCRAYGDLTHCFADDTEILTANGWRGISNVSVGTQVLALDLKTERAHLTPVVRSINLPYVGDLLHFATEAMDLLVTPNHDLVWRSKAGNDAYYRRKNMPIPRPPLHKSSAETFEPMGGHHPRRGSATIQWEGETPDRIRISDDMYSLGRTLPGEFDAGDLSELLGWFVSEGHVDLSSKGHYRISIAQSSTANQAKVQEIVGLVRRMGFSPSVKFDRVVFDSKPLALFLSRLGLSRAKRVPSVVRTLSPVLLKRFISSAVKGDGTENGTGWTYATTSAQLADDMQEIALKAGYRSSLRIEARAGNVGTIRGRSFTSKSDMYMVGIFEPSDAWYPKPKRVPYKGQISCVTLGEYNNIMVRRNGKALWAGNCWPPVSEFWFYYLNKVWREANAPHNDMYTCDFDVTWGHSLHPEIQPRNAEYQQHALKFWKEAAQDTHATLTKK